LTLRKPRSRVTTSGLLSSRTRPRKLNLHQHRRESLLSAEEGRWPYWHVIFTDAGIVRNRVLSNRVWVFFGITVVWMVVIFTSSLTLDFWLVSNAGFLTVLAELFGAFLPTLGTLILIAWLSERKRKWLAKLSPDELVSLSGANLIPYPEVVSTRFTPRPFLVEVGVNTKRGSLVLRIRKQELEPLRTYLGEKTPALSTDSWQ
jgi:hypothetical protein